MINRSSGPGVQEPFNPFTWYGKPTVLDEWMVRNRPSPAGMNRAAAARRSRAPGVPYEITVFTKDKGLLTKQIELGDDGKVISDGSACKMSKGRARRVLIVDLQSFADVIEQLKSNQAIVLGTLRDGLPEDVEVVTKDKLDGQNGVIARTKEFIEYRKGQSALVLADYDQKGMPKEVADRFVVADFIQNLARVLTGLRDTAYVLRKSTSAGLSRTDTGEELPGSGGWHCFIAARDGSDIARFLNTLHQRCWLAGFGWLMVDKGGKILERSIVDRSVGSPERLVFEGPPKLKPPLAQDAESRRPIVNDGEMLDTVAACPPLTPSEQAQFDKLIATAKRRMQPELDKVRGARAQEIVDHTGVSMQEARQTVADQCDREVLSGELVLPFDDKELEGCTVVDVLDDPERFEGRTLADPLDPEDGRGKAKIMCRRDDERPWIKSFAHGGRTFTLIHDPSKRNYVEAYLDEVALARQTRAPTKTSVTAQENDAADNGEAQENVEADTKPGLFDPWAQFIVPEFPLDVLPPVVQEFVATQSDVIGVDQASMAMCVMSAFSGALSHMFSVKMMRHGNLWWPRLRQEPLFRRAPGRALSCRARNARGLHS